MNFKFIPMGGSDMKLVIAITSKSDAHVVAGAMTKAGYPSTVTDSYGGFSGKGNAMIFSGVDDSKINTVTKIIRDNTDETVAELSSHASGGKFKLPPSVKVGGAVVFVLPIEQFLRL